MAFWRVCFIFNGAQFPPGKKHYFIFFFLLECHDLMRLTPPSPSRHFDWSSSAWKPIRRKYEALGHGTICSKWIHEWGIFLPAAHFIFLFMHSFPRRFSLGHESDRFPYWSTEEDTTPPNPHSHLCGFNAKAVGWVGGGASELFEMMIVCVSFWRVRYFQREALWSLDISPLETRVVVCSRVHLHLPAVLQKNVQRKSDWVTVFSRL